VLRRALTQELKIRPLEKRKRPVRLILGSMGAVAVIGGVLALLLRRRRRA
jgi:hypothetical protein